jgi:hypothetical protein
MIPQIQAWPTPEIFIRKGGRPVFDRASAGYSLISVVKPTADARTVGPDSAAAAYSLVSLVKNPPVTETVTEQPASAAYSLVSVLQYTPFIHGAGDGRVTEAGDSRVTEAGDSRVTEGGGSRGTDAPAAAYSLASVLVYTADTRDLSATPEAAAGSYSLVSVDSV